MKIRQLLSILIVLLISGCAAKRQTTATIPQPETHIVEAPKPHTALTQGARVNVVWNEKQMSATCTVMAVRDSMIAISVRAWLGIEVVRIEVTPEELVVFDKLNHQYSHGRWDKYGQLTEPEIKYQDLEALAFGELCEKQNTMARLEYKYGKMQIQLSVDMPNTEYNEPIQIRQLDSSRYTEVKIENIL